QILRHGHADLHATIGFVSAVIFVGPPDARADPLTGRDDEVVSKIVTSPRYPANPWWILTDDRNSFVSDFDFVFDSFSEFLFEHYPVDIAFAFEFELLVAVSDFCDCEGRLQVDLHLVSGFYRLESDRVRSFQASGFR